MWHRNQKNFWSTTSTGLGMCVYTIIIKVSLWKAFPNCKFAEKCLFVHTNCKYDTKCTKANCPFTHMSRRAPVLTLKPVSSPAPSTGQLCHYFPACKKTECPWEPQDYSLKPRGYGRHGREMRGSHTGKSECSGSNWSTGRPSNGRLEMAH